MAQASSVLLFSVETAQAKKNIESLDKSLTELMTRFDSLNTRAPVVGGTSQPVKKATKSFQDLGESADTMLAKVSHSVGGVTYGFKKNLKDTSNWATEAIRLFKSVEDNAQVQQLSGWKADLKNRAKYNRDLADHMSKANLLRQRDAYNTALTAKALKEEKALRAKALKEEKALRAKAIKDEETSASRTLKNATYRNKSLQQQLNTLKIARDARDSGRVSDEKLRNRFGDHVIKQLADPLAIRNIENAIEQQKRLLELVKQRDRLARTASRHFKLLDTNTDHNAKYKRESETARAARIVRAASIREEKGSTAHAGRRVGSRAALDSLNPKILADARRQLEATAPAASSAAQSIRQFGLASRDTHSFVRGLSGSLNQLWLTYGALAPLLTGAALGSIARSTFTVGKDLEYRLKFVEALGNNPIKVSDTMSAVQGSMKTPLEAAEALQALAQAGLSAEQSLSALKATMQLSTLGELGMTEAAIAMTGTLSAYSLTAAEAGKVGDVFAKAAAISNTSVEQISSSMRQASTAAAQYGITVEETTAALAVMAKRNITGSMAGTSYRNALKELYTPIARGAKAMKTLGISAYDANNNMKPMTQLLRELEFRLGSLSEKSKNEALEAIFGERGGKAMRPILDDLNAYEKSIDEMHNSIGFLEEASMKLLRTTEGQLNIFQSALQQSFSKAFDNIKPTVNSVIVDLKKLVESEGFVDFVAGLTKGFAELTRYLMDNRDAIGFLVKSYLAYKGVMLTIDALSRGMNAVARTSVTLSAMQTTSVWAHVKAKHAEAVAIAASNREMQKQNVIAATNSNKSSKVGLAAGAVAAGSGTFDKVKGSALGLGVGLTFLGRAFSALVPAVGVALLAMEGFTIAKSLLVAESKEVGDALKVEQNAIDEYVNALALRAAQIEAENKRFFSFGKIEEETQLSMLEKLKAQKDILDIQVESYNLAQDTIKATAEELKITKDVEVGFGNANRRRQEGKVVASELKDVEQAQLDLQPHIVAAINARTDATQNILNIERQILNVQKAQAAAAVGRAHSPKLQAIEAGIKDMEEARAFIEVHGKDPKKAQQVAKFREKYEGLQQRDLYKMQTIAQNEANAMAEGAKLFTEAGTAFKGSEETQKAFSDYMIERRHELLVQARQIEKDLSQWDENLSFETAKGGGGSTPRYKPTRGERASDGIVNSAYKLHLGTQAGIAAAYRKELEEQKKLQEEIAKKYMSEKDLYALDFRNKVEADFNKLIEDRKKKIDELKEVITEGTGGASEYTAKQIEDARSQLGVLAEDIQLIEAQKAKATQSATSYAKENYDKQFTFSARLQEESKRLQDNLDKTWYTVADSMVGAMDRAIDGLANFVATGDISIKEFAANTLAELSKMAFKIAANQILMSIIGSFMNVGMGAAASGQSFISGRAFTTGGFTSTGPAMTLSAQGNVFSGGSHVKRFAKGGAFTNSVVKRPHVAPMAMFGEAGPEAIMPLTRMPGGDLGIKAIPTGAPSSGSAPTNVVVNTNIVVNSDGTSNSQTSSSDGEGLYQQLGEMVSARTKEIIMKEIGQGGMIRRAIKER